jgi:phage portal protein BeeE
MDFIAAKHSSARDIALAFGVPPQLLGIPGDNTYNNLKEARIALWEQTIIPLVDNTLKYINKWLRSILECDFEITYNPDNIPALSLSRQILWENIDKISFMSVDEKRSMVGLGAIQKNIKTNQFIKDKKH